MKALAQATGPEQLQRDYDTTHVSVKNAMPWKVSICILQRKKIV